MTTEERLDRMESNLQHLVAVQDQMMDVLGLSIEGERRLATRVERMEQVQEELQATIQETARQHNETAKRHNALAETVLEIGDKLNALIAVVDGIVRGRS